MSPAILTTRLYHIATSSSALLRYLTLVAVLVLAVSLGGCLSSNAPSAVAVRTATAMSILSGNLQAGSAGAALPNPVILQVFDQYGIPLIGVPVSIAASASSGSVSPATVTSDTAGKVSVSWTLGKTTGTDSLTVTSAGLTSVTVVAIARPGAPASLVVVRGSAQTATAGTTLSTPLVVKVTDQYGNPVPNATVQWSSDANGTFAATTEVTDADGLAQNTYTLAPKPGRQNIVAMVTSGASVIVTTLVAVGS